MGHDNDRRRLLYWTAPLVSAVVLPAHATTSAENSEEVEQPEDDQTISPEDLIRILEPILFNKPR